MPYQTGITTSTADLVSTITAFCTSNGWTLTGNVLHKGNVYVELGSDSGYSTVRGGKGESGGALASPSLSVAKLATINLPLSVSFSWPATYHLFAFTNPDFVLCVVNYNVLYCQWITFGEIEKYGSWAGGQYFGAPFFHDHTVDGFRFEKSRAYQFSEGYELPSCIGLWFATKRNLGTRYGSMQMVCDIDGSDWIDNGGVASGVKFQGSYIGQDIPLYSPNAWNEQAVLSPVWVSVDRPSSKRSIIGTVPAIRHLNISNYNVGDILTIGSDKWMVFPHYKKNVAADLTGTLFAENTSGPLGFAVKYDGP